MTTWQEGRGWGWQDENGDVEAENGRGVRGSLNTACR